MHQLCIELARSQIIHSMRFPILFRTHDLSFQNNYCFSFFVYYILIYSDRAF